eukprot:1124739-Pyramimonas_sp.AAC.1
MDSCSASPLRACARRPWTGRAFGYDASSLGHGVWGVRCVPEAAAVVDRVRERVRFRCHLACPGAPGPRALD